jgi:hypothetical protein
MEHTGKIDMLTVLKRFVPVKSEYENGIGKEVHKRGYFQINTN